MQEALVSEGVGTALTNGTDDAGVSGSDGRWSMSRRHMCSRNVSAMAACSC